MRKQSFLPKAWLLQKCRKDKSGYVEFYARFGHFISSDFVEDMRETIYILPCLSFSFNHSEVFVKFAWLNYSCHVWCRDYKRYDAYMYKMMQKKEKSML